MKRGPSVVAAQWRRLIRVRPFHPHRWIPSGHLQTIVAARQRRRFPAMKQEFLAQAVQLEDGARLEVHRLIKDSSAPTLVAVHGMSGSSESDYMAAFSVKAWSRGWNALLFNLYDRDGFRAVPRLFDAGCSAQLREAIDRLRFDGSLDQVMLVGVSMGGNIVLKTLGDWGREAPEWVLGGAVISPLVDLSVSWQPIERWQNWVYRSYYLRRLKSLTLENRVAWSSVVDFQRLARARTIRQYDEIVTAPLGGYGHVHRYYEAASASRVAGSIEVPTLAIHALDDPFLPAEPLTRPEVTENPWLLVELTAGGGHVGFIEDRKQDVDRMWAENRVVDFCSLLVR